MASSTSTAAAKQLSERILTRLMRLHYETDLDTIVEALDSLEPMLTHHFEIEEREGGVFSELADAHPESRARLEAFAEEHKEILDAIQALRAEVQDVMARMEACSARMGALVDTIRTHEGTEHELMRELKGRH